MSDNDRKKRLINQIPQHYKDTFLFRNLFIKHGNKERATRFVLDLTAIIKKEDRRWLEDPRFMEKLKKKAKKEKKRVQLTKKQMYKTLRPDQILRHHLYKFNKFVNINKRILRRQRRKALSKAGRPDYRINNPRYAFMESFYPRFRKVFKKGHKRLRHNRKVIKKGIHRTGRTKPVEYINTTLSLVKPPFILRRVIAAGKPYTLPVPITDHRASYLACKWLKKGILHDTASATRIPTLMYREFHKTRINKGEGIVQLKKYISTAIDQRPFSRFIRKKRKLKHGLFIKNRYYQGKLKIKKRALRKLQRKASRKKREQEKRKNIMKYMKQLKIRKEGIRRYHRERKAKRIEFLKESRKHEHVTKSDLPPAPSAPKVQKLYKTKKVKRRAKLTRRAELRKQDPEKLRIASQYPDVLNAPSQWDWSRPKSKQKSPSHRTPHTVNHFTNPPHAIPR